MNPENPDEALLEQGLAAWDVPEPPPGLTDRILAHNAETLADLSAAPTQIEPPTLKDDRPAMLPTALRTESSTRPFWTATALGFAAAAAIVVAFMAGRQSTPAAVPVSTVVPSVEIQVTAPAPVALPPVPPVPPALPEKIIISETTEPVDPPPKPPRVRGVRVSPDLKNPFDTGDDSSRSPKPKNAGNQPLKDPFATGEATLRLATNSGSAPAEVTVDGKPIGTTPIASHKVSPGEHTVVFRWPGKRRSFTINVEADMVKVIRADDK